MSNVIETARDLVRIPSYSGQEKPVRNYIAKLFEREQIPTIEQRGNLIVHLKGIDSTRAFIFNSHMDVVNIGDPKDWTCDPWGGAITAGRIYGRGASDMKGGMAGAIDTALRLARRQSLPTDVWFTFVVKEEVDGSGTNNFSRWFVRNGFTSRYQDMAAIFTEPTQLAIAEHGHKGNYFIDASIHGEAGHSGRPREIKINAPERLVAFLDKLRQVNEDWRNRFDGKEFTPPTITVTALTAKSKSYNRVAPLASAHLDLRTIPGFHQEAFDEIQTLSGESGITLSFPYPPAPTGYTSADTAIIRVIQEEVTGVRLELSEASADLGFLTDIGVNGVIFGPGEKSQGHRTDESAPVDQIERTPDLYEQIYNTWVMTK